MAALPDDRAERRAELTAVLATGEATALLPTAVPERALREAFARALVAARAAGATRLTARCLAELVLLEAAAIPAPRRSAEGRTGRPAPQPTTAVIGELSPRELEVLQLLAQMLSTDEIATSLFVSINTVRTHIRSILRKLGAARRNEAVRRARELHLLDAAPSSP